MLVLNSMPCLSNGGWCALNALVSREEVRATVMGMKSLKVLGPNGFQPFFFKEY